MNNSEQKSAPVKVAPKKPRIVFIDQARALALIMMIMGHSLHHFLGEPWRSGHVYEEYQFFRGITSALFLMVSGFSFVVASFRYWDDYTHISPRLMARARRIGYILFLAYLLHMYGGTLYRLIAWYTPAKLVGFLRFDVLQNIGLGLLILHTAAFAVKKIEHFWKVTLGLLLFVIGIAAVTYNPSVDSVLPIWLAPAVNMFHHSLFPLVPFTAFMLVGAFSGYFFWMAKQKGSDWKVMLVFAVSGVVLIGLEWVIGNWVPGGVFPYSVHMDNMPGNTFARCGSAMLVIATFYFLEKVVRILPRLSLTMSKDSLAIYVVHLPIIYGGTLGAFQQYKEGMSPVGVFSYIGVLFTAMVLMAYLIDLVRRHYPAQQTKVRRILILAWIIHFFVWPDFTVVSVSSAIAVAAFFLLGGPQRTMDKVRPWLNRSSKSQESTAD